MLLVTKGQGHEQMFELYYHITSAPRSGKRADRSRIQPLKLPTLGSFQGVAKKDENHEILMPV